MRLLGQARLGLSSGCAQRIAWRRAARRRLSAVHAAGYVLCTCSRSRYAWQCPIPGVSGHPAKPAQGPWHGRLASCKTHAAP